MQARWGRPLLLDGLSHMEIRSHFSGTPADHDPSSCPPDSHNMTINSSRPEGATSSEMRLQSIPEKSKRIIDSMRALIEKDETDHLKVDTRGWQYGGKTFTELVVLLQKETKEELQHQNLSVRIFPHLLKRRVANRVPCR